MRTLDTLPRACETKASCSRNRQVVPVAPEAQALLVRLADLPAVAIENEDHIHKLQAPSHHGPRPLRLNRSAAPMAPREAAHHQALDSHHRRTQHGVRQQARQDAWLRRNRTRGSCKQSLQIRTRQPCETRLETPAAASITPPSTLSIGCTTVAASYPTRTAACQRGGGTATLAPSQERPVLLASSGDRPQRYRRVVESASPTVTNGLHIEA